MVLQETHFHCHRPADSPPRPGCLHLRGQWGCLAVAQQSPFSSRADLCSFSLHHPPSQSRDHGTSTSSKKHQVPVLRFHQQIMPTLLFSFLCSSASPLLFLLFPPQVSKRSFCSFSWEAAKKSNAHEFQQAAYHMNRFSREIKAPPDLSSKQAFSQCTRVSVYMC